MAVIVTSLREATVKRPLGRRHRGFARPSSQNPAWAACPPGPDGPKPGTGLLAQHRPITADRSGLFIGQHKHCL